MGIGDRIKNIRKEINLTQKELADIVNVSSQVISNWEREYTELSADDVSRLIKALDVKHEDIFGHADNNKSVTNAALPKLTDKDERDIAKDLEHMINNISTNGYAQFDGGSIEELDEEDKELLIASLENSMRLAKRLAKQKFTPKEHQKD